MQKSSLKAAYHKPSTKKWPKSATIGHNFAKLSRLSRNFSDHLENIQPIRKLSRLSRNFADHPAISRLSGSFPDGPETSQCNFKGYAQKLSGRAKTFRVAMPPCHPGFCASAWWYWVFMVQCLFSTWWYWLVLGGNGSV